MSSTENNLLIGVDGGGSRCRFALAGSAGRVLARHESGSANIATNFDAARVVIADGLGRVLQAVGAGTDSACHVHLGLAGANAPDAADHLRRILSVTFPAANLVIEDDRKTAVAAALGGGDGAVASCGTGSFVCRQEGLVLTGIGGWGLALGDDASGAWLGQNAMRRAVLGLDGVIAMTDLLRQIAAATGGDRAAMVGFSLRAAPPDYAALAPMVIDAAIAGDAEALRLMVRGAGYLRDALQVLGYGAGQDVCLLGGVGRHYAPYLPEYTARPPRLPAVSGALILAARAAGLEVEGKPWT